MKASRFAVLALALATASACFGPGQLKRYFDFQTGIIPVEAGGPVLAKSLDVGRVDVADVWNDFRIIYRRSATELNYYPNEFWAGKPDRLLRETIFHYLQERKVFAEVGLEGDRESHDWVLRCRVHRLEEVDLANIWGARLAMDMSVVENKTGQVIETRSFDRTMPLARKSVSELPVGLSKILIEELEALVQSLRGKGPSPR